MKNIITIISALLFIAGSAFLDIDLSEGNRHVPVVIKQQAFTPVIASLCNEKTESLPFDKCHCEKQVEGVHIVNSRIGSVSNLLSRHIAFAASYLFNKHSATALPISTQASSTCIAQTLNNVSLHIRNCVWLI